MGSAPKGSPVKLVIDTNIIVSGLFWRGAPSQLMIAVVDGPVQHVCSAALLEEFIVVIDRSKFIEPLNAMDCTVSDLFSKISAQAKLVVPADIKMPPGLRDPKDLMVLAAAVGGEADAIVTGDKDLLTLGEFRGIPILDVAGALARL